MNLLNLSFELIYLKKRKQKNIFSLISNNNEKYLLFHISYMYLIIENLTYTQATSNHTKIFIFFQINYVNSFKLIGNLNLSFEILKRRSHIMVTINYLYIEV